MARQVITGSLTHEQADVVYALAAKLRRDKQRGGVSAAMQFLVDFYLAHFGSDDGNALVIGDALVIFDVDVAEDDDGDYEPISA
jgi:hypothetical protein